MFCLPSYRIHFSIEIPSFRIKRYIFHLRSHRYPSKRLNLYNSFEAQMNSQMSLSSQPIRDKKAEKETINNDTISHSK